MKTLQLTLWCAGQPMYTYLVILKSDFTFVLSMVKSSMRMMLYPILITVMNICMLILVSYHLLWQLLDGQHCHIMHKCLIYRWTCYNKSNHKFGDFQNCSAFTDESGDIIFKKRQWCASLQNINRRRYIFKLWISTWTIHLRNI